MFPPLMEWFMFPGVYFYFEQQESHLLPVCIGRYVIKAGYDAGERDSLGFHNLCAEPGKWSLTGGKILREGAVADICWHPGP